MELTGEMIYKALDALVETGNYCIDDIAPAESTIYADLAERLNEELGLTPYKGENKEPEFTLNYQQIELNLSSREGEEITVTAYEAEGTGLAYNALNGKEEFGYMITHLASKYGIIWIDTEYEAKQLLEQIASLTDWHQPEEAFVNRVDLSAKVQDARTDIIQRLNMQIESACSQCMPSYLVEDILDNLDDDGTLRRTLLYAFKIV